MASQDFTLVKIPIKQFMDILVSLYEQGVDYIDLIAQPDNQQDTLKISYNDSYINKDYNSELKEETEDDDDDDKDSPPPTNIILSEDDINNLL